jgi:hypothetical protein
MCNEKSFDNFKEYDEFAFQYGYYFRMKYHEKTEEEIKSHLALLGEQFPKYVANGIRIADYELKKN